jgi:hypothetical protein
MRFVAFQRLLMSWAALVLFPGCACDQPSSGGEPEGEGEGEGEGGEGEGGCRTAFDCDDGDACTVDACVDDACRHTTALDGTVCGDTPCSGEAACQAGACVQGAPANFDADGDGSPSALCVPGGDCNDSDPRIFPGAGENSDSACQDGVDNDCDGAIDADDVGCGNTRVCDFGWCFDNPLPHGFAHRALWPVGDDVWVGGEGVFNGSGSLGAMEFTSDGDNVTVVDLWVSPAATDDVWMVGFDGSRSVLGRRIGGGFVFEDAPVPGATAIFGFAADDVWMAGQTGAVAHFDGTAWAQLGDVGAFNAIHGSAADDVWFVGIGGDLLHWDGATFTPFSPDVPGFFLSVWAVSDVLAFAAGPDGVWSFDGAAWTKMVGAPGGNAVTATSATDVWLGANSGQALHYDGATWAFNLIGPPGGAVVEMHARSPSDVWAAGGAGLLVHYDGAAWTHPSGGIPASAFIFDLETAQDGEGELVAFATSLDFRTNAPSILQRAADGTWAPTGPESGALVVAAHGVDDVWAMLGSSAHHFDGSTWSTVGISTPPLRNGGPSTNDVCATADGTFYAVGSNFGSIRDTYVLRYDGAAWVTDLDFAEFANRGDPLVKQIHCVGNDVWLSGPDDELWKQTSTGWQRYGLKALAEGGNPVRGFVGETSWWAIATGPTDRTTGVVHFNGQDALEVRVPELDARTTFTDVSGTSDNDVWMVGEGFAYHYDGAQLVPRALHEGGVTPQFRFVFPFDVDDVVFVDVNGSVFHYTGADELVLLLRSSFADLTSGSATDASHIWLVDSGTVEFFDGVSLIRQNIPAEAVHAFAANDVWAVGDRADVAHYNGVSWQTERLASNGSFTSVGGTSGSDVWVGGLGRVAQHGRRLRPAASRHPRRRRHLQRHRDLVPESGRNSGAGRRRRPSRRAVP